MFLFYNHTLPPGCGGNLIGTVGSFSSPGHPNNYPHGVTCNWYITVEPGMVIRLTFNTFNLERSANCQYDYVEIFDNSTSTDTGGALGRWVLLFFSVKKKEIWDLFDHIQSMLILATEPNDICTLAVDFVFITAKCKLMNKFDITITLIGWVSLSHWIFFGGGRREGGDTFGTG